LSPKAWTVVQPSFLLLLILVILLSLQIEGEGIPATSNFRNTGLRFIVKTVCFYPPTTPNTRTERELSGQRLPPVGESVYRFQSILVSAWYAYFAVPSAFSRFIVFADCRSYGVKVEAENAPRNIHIYNCRFRDIGVRAIKGSAGQDPNIRAVKGSIRYCSFENTRVPPADWLYGGDYISPIDMMALEDWTISDNCFRNIKGHNGGGRAAIFIWVRSRQIVVERNLIVDCDRGVAFGNPGQSTASTAGERLVYVSDGIIRNNFIVGGPDCGIELWHVERIKVFNNTIWRPERNWNRGIRVGTGTARTEIVNNLAHGEIRLDGGEAQLRNNLTGKLDGYFVDPALGNLALTANANGAIDQGVSLPEVTDDIRGKRRAARPDPGAWESDR